MWYNKLAQNIAEPETPNPEYEEATGRNFNLINKQTGIKEDVLVPFNSDRDYNQDIAGSSHMMFIGTPTECFEFIKKNPSASQGKITSAYILTDGRCVIIYPHHHDQVARTILPKNLVPETHDYDRDFVGKVDSTMMPSYTGAVRVQMLPDGIGVMADMTRPPVEKQMDAIREYYSLTNGDTFVAEIRYNGQLIAWLQSWPDLARCINNFKKGSFNSEPHEDIRRFLQRQDSDEAWYGREFRANQKRKKIVFA